MDIGIGLPNAVHGVDRPSILGFATRAEERGFSSLATIDRLAFHNYEPLVTLGAAGAVTERINLVTDVLNLPWHQNAALIAKQAATLDNFSQGRLVRGTTTTSWPGCRRRGRASAWTPCWKDDERVGGRRHRSRPVSR